MTRELWEGSEIVHQQTDWWLSHISIVWDINITKR